MATITLNTRLNTTGAIADARRLQAKLAQKPIELTINRKSLAQPLGRISGDVAEFTKSLQAATARVTAFGATSGGIIAVSQAISQVAKSVIEVDKQLTELNTFLGQSQSNLSAVGDKLFKIAKNTASSFEDTAEAAKEFARQGLSLEETLTRTNDALILSRVSGLGAAESVNALTTAINSFNKSALSSTELVNKLIKVDSNFAVSSADLAQALTRVGSAAQDSGVGVDEFIATVTAAQQVTGRGGAVIGNALKTIFTRLKRPEVLDQLQQLGVAVKDQNGALLSGTQVLTNYINATKNLSQVEKARNDELLGGVYQINQLKAITNDLAKSNGIYARSLQMSNMAADDAIEKNKELNKSLSAILQNTKTNFQQKGASIGEPLVKPIVKRGTDIVNFLLNAAGTDTSKAGKQGEKVGETFGQAILKGIGEAISGPGLVLFGALSINIGKRLFGFVNDAAKVLLNISSRAANVQAIEQAINNTLAQQPKITEAIIKGQISREQAAAQLLRLYTQQNQQLAVQKGLATNLAQTFAKSGYVASPEYGIYKASKIKRKSEGYIPNYALKQEESEARRRNAPADVKAFATTAVIGGKEQTIIMNNYEDKQDRFRGGVDSAIIPRYAKGSVPNSAKKMLGYHTTGSDVNFGRNIDSTKSSGQGQGQGFYFWKDKESAKKHAEFLSPSDSANKGAFKIIAGRFDKKYVVPDYEVHTKEAAKFLKENQDLLSGLKLGIGGISGVKVNPEFNTFSVKMSDSSGKNKIKSLSFNQEEGNIGSGKTLGPLFDALRVQNPERIRAFEESLINQGGKAFRYIGPETKGYFKNLAKGYIPNFNRNQIKDLLSNYRKTLNTLEKGDISFLKSSQFKGAQGAYNSDTDRIYLNPFDFIKDKFANLIGKRQSIAGLNPTAYTLAHEAGHKFAKSGKAGLSKALEASSLVFDKNLKSGSASANFIESNFYPKAVREAYPKSKFFEEMLVDPYTYSNPRLLVNTVLEAGLNRKKSMNLARLHSRFQDSATKGEKKLSVLKALFAAGEMAIPDNAKKLLFKAVGKKYDPFRFSSGYIPNLAKNVVYYKSNEELKKIIESQSPLQKFLRLSFISEKGFKESATIRTPDITSSSVVQRGVRKDLLKNAPPPKGFNSWKEFQDARLILSIRKAQTDAGDSGFRYRRLDRITEAAIGGTIYKPSPELNQRNALTRSLNAKQLRKAGLQPLSATSARLASGGIFERNIYDQMAASAGGDQRKILQATDNFINDFKKSKRFSKGYIPNFAAGRGPSRGYITPPRATVATGEAAMPNKSAFDTSIMSAVQTAIYFALPSALGGFANESNQEAVSGSLKAAAALSVIAGAVQGGRRGGIPGFISGTIGGAVTGSVLLSQAGQVKENVQSKAFEKARDKAQNSFNKLTENITDLTQTIADIDAQYSDPNARPDALLKLAKKEREILRKLSAGNPEAAAAYTAAATPAEKQMALATAGETAQKELALSKTIIDFSQLKGSERDAKTIGAFFKDLATQLDNEKVNVKDLNEQNFQDFLSKGGIGKAGGLFNEGAAGEQLKKFFIQFLKVQNQIEAATKGTEAKLLEVRRPSIERRAEIERSQQIRAARGQARAGYLESVERFAGNFGERAGIEAKTMVDKYTASRPVKETFANQVRVQAESLTSPALKTLITSYAAAGPNKELSDRLKSLIKDPNTQKFYAQDIDILKKILAQNTTSARELETIQQISKEQKTYALKALSLQEKLNFGGGIKTSIDAEARIQSVKNTQRGALQYQLGSLFGSKETQAAGLTNFASNLKEKYPGLFESQAGQQIFGGLRDQLTSFRATDMRESMLRDAITAQSIGQTGLASLLQGQAGPQGAQSLNEMARLQAEQQLGLTPSVVGKSITEAEAANVSERQQKLSEDFALKTLEESLKPQLDAISGAFIKTINQLQAPLEASLKESFSKGLEITNATLVVTNLELGSLFGKTSQSETTNKAGGFIPNFSNSQNPLTAALGRESNALKQRGINPIMPMAGGYIPNFASAKVSVVSDNRIANGGNPNGLAVINSIDEPNGMIPRAKGYIPNFAMPSWMNLSNLDRARTGLTSADDAYSFSKDIKEKNIISAGMDLLGPSLDIAQFLAKGVGKKAFGAASIGLDVGEYIVKPISEKLGITDYLGNKMYDSYSYLKNFKLGGKEGETPRSIDIIGSELGEKLTSSDPEWMKTKKRNFSNGFIPNFAAKKKKSKSPAVTESTIGQIEPAYEPLPPYLEGNKYANEIAFASEVIYTRLELNKASKEQREIIKQKTNPAVLQAAISGQTFLPSGSNRISPEIQKAIQEAALQDLLKEADLGNLSSKEAKELTTKLKTEGYRQQKTEEISDVKKQLTEAANKGPLARLGSLQKDLIIAKRTKNERAIQALERTIALEKSGILDLTTPQLQESVSAQKATEQSILLDPKKRAYQESLDAIRYMSETGRMVKEASKGPLTGASSATIARLLANPPSSSPLVPITPLVPRTPLALLPASTSTLAPSTTSKLKPTGINILPSSGKTFLMEGPKIIPTLNDVKKKITQGELFPNLLSSLEKESEAIKAKQEVDLNKEIKRQEMLKLLRAPIGGVTGASGTTAKQLDLFSFTKRGVSPSKATSDALKVKPVSPQILNREQFLNDPLIQAAVQDFKNTLSGKGGGASGMGGGGGAGGGTGGGVFKPFALLPAPGQTTTTGPWTELTAGIQQRVFEQGGSLQTEFRSSNPFNIGSNIQKLGLSIEEVIANEQKRFDEQYAKKTSLSRGVRETRRNIRLQNAPFGKFGAARRALYDYNRNTEAQNKAALIKNIILSQSGLSPIGIKAMTGLYPNQLEGLSPSSLESLLRKRNINIEQKNIEGFGRRSSPEFFVEPQLLTNIDLTKARLTPEEIAVLEKSAAEAKPTRRFITDPSGRITEQTTSTLAQKVVKYPDLVPQESTVGAASPDFERRKSFLNNLPSAFLSGISNINKQIGGFTGYVGEKEITKKANELLKLEDFFSKSSESLSEGFKQASRDKILAESGPYAAEVQQKFNDLLNENNLRAIEAEIKTSPGIKDIRGGTMNEGNLEILQERLGRFVEKGMLTSEQASQIQEKIALKEKGMGVMEYDRALQNLADRRGAGEKGANVRGYYESIAETGGAGAKEGQIINRQRNAEIAAVNNLIQNEGIIFYTDELGRQKTRPGSRNSVQQGEKWVSFTNRRVQAIEANIAGGANQQTLFENLRKLRALETDQRSSFAKRFGMEYDPITGKVVEQGTSAAIRAEELQQLESQKPISKFSKIKNKLGGILSGPGAGFYGLYGAYGTAKAAFKASEEGQNAEAIGLAGSAVLLGAGGATMIKRVQNILGENVAHKIGGIGFGLSGSIIKGLESAKEFENKNNGKSAYLGLESLVSASAAISAGLGQKLLTQRLFALSAGLDQLKQIYDSPNFQLAGLSDEQMQGGFLNKIGAGLLTTFTGQNFSDGFNWKNIEPAIGDVIGSAFTFGMGPAGAAVTVAKLGYRAGNVLEQVTGLGDTLGSLYVSDKQEKRAAEKLDIYGMKKSDAIEKVFGGDEAAYADYLRKQRYKEGYFTPSNETGGFGILPSSAQIGNTVSGVFSGFANLGSFMFGRSKKKSTGSQMAAEDMGMSYFANGFIPNFADKEENTPLGTSGVFSTDLGPSFRKTDEEYQKERDELNAESRRKIVKTYLDAQNSEISRDKVQGLINSGIQFDRKDFAGNENLYDSYISYSKEKQNTLMSEKNALSNPNVVQFREQVANQIKELNSYSQEEIKNAYTSGVSLNDLRTKNQEDNLIGPTGRVVGGLLYSEAEIKEAYSKGISLEELKRIKRNRKLRKNNSNGFVPNFALAMRMEQNEILTNPDYAGYRNAKPMMSRSYNNVIVNSSEMEVPAREVYARMGLPPGTKPKNSSEQTAILNPAQQKSLGYAAGGFVPNFSSEEFMTNLSSAMKEGMAAAFANGFIPNSSPNSYNNSITFNGNTYSDQENNDMFKEVLRFLVSKNKDLAGALGPQITKIIS